MANLSWLHLSDWHQKDQDFGRQLVRDALIRDIHQREQIDPRLAQVDFIIFSGDLAFSAKSAEYEAARIHLFDPVLKATGLEADRIFCVPGNHDLNRDIIYEMLPYELQKPLNSDALIQKWLTDPKRRARVLEPFEAYSEFISKYTGQPDPDYASILHLEIAGKRIALLGINSAWMCARNKDSHSEVNDYGFTLVGEPQIHDALTQIAVADLKIAVMHHPFDWLTVYDRDHIEDRLMREVHFILRGHEHKPKVSAVHSTAGDCVVIPAGASYKRRIAEDPRYTNAYNFALLDFEADEGTVFLRRWSDPRNEWVEDTDTHLNGKFSINPLPKNLHGATSSSTASVTTSSVSEIHALTHNHQIVEQRYQDLLLETCDIINLANLPEQDRHISQKQQNLKLRGLYIPLRVQIEVSADEERVDSEQEDKVWDALEKRRAMALRGELSKHRKDGEYQRVPVGARLAVAKRLIVLGDPGAGKTTLTRWIATAYLLRLRQSQQWVDLPDVQTLPDADWLPIIVRCRDLDSDSLTGSLDDILKHTLRKAELKQEDIAELRSLLQTRIEDGQALLMLDGLDEITDPSVRAGFCQQLEQIAIAYPHVPIIATSRIVGYREMGYKLTRGFEHLTLADLTRNEKDDFARRWCALTEIPERRIDAAKELIHDIHSADRIERLTGNPMLLTTMALVKRKIGKLPNRRAELYWEAVQVLLNWRSDVGAQLDVREALPQLEYLAYYMCDRGVQQLRKDEILDLFTRMRKEYPYVHASHNRSPDDFLKCLEARTGILIEAGQIRHLGMLMPVYEFRHLTFQEYLAARALVDGRFPGRDSKQSLAAHVAPLAGRTTDTAFTEGGPKEVAVVENWREALRLCAAICNDDDIDSFLYAVITPQEGESKATHRARAILATLCVADEPNVSEEALQKIFRAFTKQVRVDDGGGLVKTGVDVATREIAGTRWSALLLTILLEDFFKSDGAKREVIGDLCGLLVALEAPPTKTDRIAWLTKQADTLRHAQDTQVVEIALGIMQLGFENKVSSVPNLAEALLSYIKSQPPVSHAVTAALNWFSYRECWQPTATEVPQLLDLFEDIDTDLGVIRHLAMLLGNIKSEAAVAPLSSRLDDTDARVRQAAASALGNIKSEAAVAPLSSRLDHADATVRRLAASVLGNIKSEAAVASLISHLDHADADTRRAVLGGLARAIEDIDRRLLSRDLDGLFPFLDPNELISSSFAQKAASKLVLTLNEVQARYEAMAGYYHLNLEWCS